MIMIQCPDVVCNVTDHINVKKTLAVWYDLFYVLSVQNRIKYDLCKKITIRYTLWELVKSLIIRLGITTTTIAATQDNTLQ